MKSLGFKISNILTRPHPVGANWMYPILLGAIVFFILFGLAPFGFRDLGVSDRLFKSLAFGVITVFSVMLNLQMCKRLLPRIFNDESWTIGYEIIYSFFDLVMIGFWNTCFLVVFELSDFPFMVLLPKIILNTITIGIIPVLVLVFVKNGQSLKAQLLLAKQLNEQLESALGNQGKQQQITFFSENQKPEIRLFADEILYLRSEGNYLEVFYLLKEEKEKRQVIRNRMKTIMRLLPEDIFFQCHKSYIVNTAKIVEMNGNSRNLKIILRGTDTQIPVSRSKSLELLSFLKSHA